MANVYCEPFCIEKGYDFEIHHVKYGEKDPYSCFMHFHEVHEFIIFDKIEGRYFYSQGESQLEDDDIVFTPALETHDFEASDKEKSWFIVQILPAFFQQPELESCVSFFQQGIHLRLPEDEMANVRQQIQWLYQSYQQNPDSTKSKVLLKLLILWIAEHAVPVKETNVLPLKSSQGYSKLTPVINKFRYETVIELTLVEAAELCHLSPSYFSRLFKKVFRYSYSEYLLRHKLYNAARMLSNDKASVTVISYEMNFSSPSHFIAQFKKVFGITPLQYQKQLHQRADSK
ncbi:MAG: helix-turn-helix transcriptional regulator [Gammaproteobacteria bacterium]|nr:helix-turn-helix transcriptional regulator [Gammaproteobacteria bacterium]